MAAGPLVPSPSTTIGATARIGIVWEITMYAEGRGAGSGSARARPKRKADQTAEYPGQRFLACEKSAQCHS